MNLLNLIVGTGILVAGACCLFGDRKDRRWLNLIVLCFILLVEVPKWTDRFPKELSAPFLIAAAHEKQIECGLLLLIALYSLYRFRKTKEIKSLLAAAALGLLVFFSASGAPITLTIAVGVAAFLGFAWVDFRNRKYTTSALYATACVLCAVALILLPR